MTISVLMSVYKSEKGEYLDRSLQSVWDDQTRKPEQIVLVEDGAIPEELELIIDSFQLRVNASGVAKMVVVKLPVNGGLTKALNAGIKHVTGDLIARMDSDDISAPQRFELQEKFFRENPEIDILGGSMQEFDDEHECLNVRHYPLTHEDACKYIVKACPLAHPAVMMRRRIFDEGLHYDERYRMSQDIKLWYDTILAGYRMANLQEIVLYFRQQGDVFRRRSRVKAWNEFKIYMNGIYRMHGLFTLAYRYPIARFVFRNLPPSLVKRIYESGMRKKVLEGTRK
jgi:glycosyltransferase involved in cell wall biosynthesis